MREIIKQAIRLAQKNKNTFTPTKKGRIVSIDQDTNLFNVELAENSVVLQGVKLGLSNVTFKENDYVRLDFSAGDKNNASIGGYWV